MTFCFWYCSFIFWELPLIHRKDNIRVRSHAAHLRNYIALMMPSHRVKCLCKKVARSIRVYHHSAASIRAVLQLPIKCYWPCGLALGSVVWATVFPSHLPHLVMKCHASFQSSESLVCICFPAVQMQKMLGFRKWLSWCCFTMKSFR